MSPICGGTGLQADEDGRCLICEAEVQLDTKQLVRVHVADKIVIRHRLGPRAPKPKPPTPVRRLVLTESEERVVLGRCPSCAEREHHCNGTCNCPVFGCSQEVRKAPDEPMRDSLTRVPVSITQ